MNEDPLLLQLGRVARQEAKPPHDDERWDALARGELGPEEEASLKALDPEAYEAFRPIDELTRRRVAATLAKPAGKRGAVARWAAAGTAVLAAAAAAMIVVRTQPEGPLPGYETTIEAGDAARRGSEGAQIAVSPLGPQGRLTLVMRPAEPVTTPLVARAFVLRGGARTPVARAPEVSPEGAVRFAGTRDELFGAVAPGEVELVVLVGRPTVVSVEGAALTRVIDAVPPSVRVARRRLSFVE